MRRCHDASGRKLRGLTRCHHRASGPSASSGGGRGELNKLRRSSSAMFRDPALAAGDSGRQLRPTLCSAAAANSARRYDRVHGHGYGGKRRRRERSGAVRHGGRPAAGGSARAGSTGTAFFRVDLLLRRGFNEDSFCPECGKPQTRPALRDTGATSAAGVPAESRRSRRTSALNAATRSTAAA